MADTVKAILFDTFGTIVDWRGSIARTGEALGKEKKLEGIDWDAFARAWRAGYVPGMARVLSGERPWTTLDVIHRERLDTILAEFGIEGAFSDEERSVIRQLSDYRCRFDVYHFEQLVFVGRDSEGEDDDFMDPGALLTVMEKIASLCEGVVVDPQANTIL